MNLLSRQQRRLRAQLLRGWALLYLLANLFVLWEMPIRLTTGYELRGAAQMLVWAAAGMLVAGVVPHLFDPRTRREAWYDLVTSLPLDLLLPAGTGMPWAALRWLRVLRITEAMHFNRTLAHWQGRSQLPPAAGRLIRLVFWILLADHFIAIGWIGIGGTEGTMPASPTFSEPFSRYIAALYWSTTTLATVGYGDITPHNDIQRLYSVFVMFTGVGVFGYVIGGIASLVANLDLERVEHQRKRILVNAFMSQRRFPRQLVEKVNEFYYYLWSHRIGRGEEAAFAELPESLRMEIALFLNRRILEKVPLFQGAGEDFLKEVVQLLKPRLYMPGDLVFREGDFGNAMYFVSNGSVEAFSESDPVLPPILMMEGSYFGEIALTEQGPRTRSIRTTGFCELYELSKDVFDQLLAKYPDFKAHIDETIRTRR